MEPRTSKKPPRPSKHITRACAGCRQRKTKCDGAKPQCANCRLHNQECIMPQGVDRRTLPTKERYARLEQYAQSLESVLVGNGLQIPERLDRHVPVSPSSTQVSNTGRKRLMTPGDGGGGRSPEIYDSYQQGAVLNRSPAPLETGPDESISQLSERFGSLQVAEDGQLRFFGATSNLHISHVGLFPLADSNIRSIHGKEQEILQRAGVGVSVPAELEERLLRLYFCWENPNIPVVHEETYYRERETYRRTGRSSHMYSEVLTNSMCAVGAALTRRQQIGIPQPAIEFFATRAKALLDVEMDCPTLCTVQALVILSGIEALLTRDARGWLYSGMAMRLSTDLGLHLKPTQRDGLDAHQIKLRRIVFWGAYIHDRMWSFYVGRPESLDDKHISVDNVRSTDFDTIDGSYWHPYTDEGQKASGPDIPALLGQVAQYTVALCRKMSNIRRVLYSTSHLHDHSVASLYSSAREFRADLRSWADSLPPTLSLETTDDQQASRPPHVLQLHMQYYAILAIIDRPFAYAWPSSLPGLTAANINESQTACTEAASAVVKILLTYRNLYSLSFMNIHTVHLIFTAAVVHLHNVHFLHNDGMRNTARRSLQVCCQSLCEIGHAYKNALRALEIIIGMKSDLARGQRQQGRPVNDTLSASVEDGTSETAALGGSLQTSGLDTPSAFDTGESILGSASLDIGFDAGWFAGDMGLSQGWEWTGSTVE